VVLARYARQDRFDGETRAQGFLNKMGSLDADRAVGRGSTGTQGSAELSEPAIIAAGELGGSLARLRCCTRSVARCHKQQTNKGALRGKGAVGPGAAAAAPDTWPALRRARRL
jgi:hypothetical protein